MRKPYYIPVVLFLLVSIYSCGIGGGVDGPDVSEGGALSESETLKYKDCQRDGDCMYVQNGCCDCANGGKDDAINKDKLIEFEANFDCTDVSCTLIGADPPCGLGTVECRFNKCEYIPPFDTNLPDNNF